MTQPNKKREHWSKSHTLVSRAKLRQAIGSYSVEPFADVIAFLMRTRPSQQALEEWVDKNPDKWANAISMFSKLYGFAEHRVIDINHNFNVGAMSDAEILQKLEELRRENLIKLTGQTMSTPLTIDHVEDKTKEKKREGSKAPPPLIRDV